MKILIVYDGSECADLIFDDLHRAGLPDYADTLILSAAECRLSEPHAEIGVCSQAGLIGHDTTSALAKRASTRMAASFPFWSVRAEALTGSPSGRLIQRAQQWNADLIIIGSPWHTALGRILSGSVSYKVAKAAPWSVRICRDRGGGHDGTIRIVVAFDGMPGAQSAVRAVAARRWPKGTAVRLLSLVGFGCSPVAELSLIEDYCRVREIQEPAESILRESGLEVSVVVREGDPKLSIIEEAKAIAADCIFIGHNDRNLLYRLLLGTVASAVVPHAPCSVEIVRSEQRAT